MNLLGTSILFLLFSLAAFAEPKMDISITAPEGADVISVSGYDKSSCEESKMPCETKGHLKKGTKVKLLGVIPLKDQANKDVDFYEIQSGNTRGYVRGDETSVYTEKKRAEPYCPPSLAPKEPAKAATDSQQQLEKMREDQINALVDIIENKLSCLDPKKTDAKKDDAFSAGFNAYTKALDGKIKSLEKNNQIDFSKFTREQLVSADAWARNIFGEMGTTCHQQHGTAYFKMVARIGMNRSYHARKYKNSPYAGPDISCTDRVESVPYVLGADKQFSMFNVRDNQFKVISCVDIKKHPYNKQAWHDAIAVAAEAIVDPNAIIKATGGSGKGGLTQLNYTSGIKPYWAKGKGWSEQTAFAVGNTTVDDPRCMRVWRGPHKNYKENTDCDH